MYEYSLPPAKLTLDLRPCVYPIHLAVTIGVG